MEEQYMINGIPIYDPDAEAGGSWETTYTSDSGRTTSGFANIVPMFTVWQETYVATDIPVEEASKIINLICRGGFINYHYFSLLKNEWRTDIFYVGKGSHKIGSLDRKTGRLASLSFNLEMRDRI